jgi:hypothetical protein
MLSIGITLLSVTLATGIVTLSFYIGRETAWGGVRLNRGTESVGLVASLAIVKRLF